MVSTGALPLDSEFNGLHSIGLNDCDTTDDKLLLRV